jgi:hypothetical protein
MAIAAVLGLTFVAAGLAWWRSGRRTGAPARAERAAPVTERLEPSFGSPRGPTLRAEPPLRMAGDRRG